MKIIIDDLSIWSFTKLMFAMLLFMAVIYALYFLVTKANIIAWICSKISAVSQAQPQLQNQQKPIFCVTSDASFVRKALGRQPRGSQGLEERDGLGLLPGRLSIPTENPSEYSRSNSPESDRPPLKPSEEDDKDSSEIQRMRHIQNRERSDPLVPAGPPLAEHTMREVNRDLQERPMEEHFLASQNVHTQVPNVTKRTVEELKAFIAAKNNPQNQ